jgi:hypothetical protein
MFIRFPFDLAFSVSILHYACCVHRICFEYLELTLLRFTSCRIHSPYTWLHISFVFSLCTLCSTNYVRVNLYIHLCICEYAVASSVLCIVRTLFMLLSSNISIAIRIGFLNEVEFLLIGIYLPVCLPSLIVLFYLLVFFKILEYYYSYSCFVDCRLYTSVFLAFPTFNRILYTVYMRRCVLFRLVDSFFITIRVYWLPVCYIFNTSCQFVYFEVHVVYLLFSSFSDVSCIACRKVKR